TEIHRIVIHPDEATRRRSHNSFRLTLSDANANAVRQHTRDHSGVNPRQFLEMFAEFLKIGAHHSGLTDITTHRSLDIFNRGSRRATRFDRFHLADARKSWH